MIMSKGELGKLKCFIASDAVDLSIVVRLCSQLMDCSCWNWKKKKKKIKGPVLPTKLFNALLYFERVNGLYKDILIRIIIDINMLIIIDIPRVKKNI